MTDNRELFDEYLAIMADENGDQARAHEIIPQIDSTFLSIIITAKANPDEVEAAFNILMDHETVYNQPISDTAMGVLHAASREQGQVGSTARLVVSQITPIRLERHGAPGADRQ